MCGLCAIYGEISGNDYKVFAKLQQFIELRGEHSSGVGLAFPGYPLEVHKSVGNSTTLWREHTNVFTEDGRLFHYVETTHEGKGRKKKKEIKKHIHPKAILGHGRFATVGKIDRANAHPFKFEHIIGMHNGTMADYWLKDIGWKSGTITDSEFILGKIDGFRPESNELRAFLSSLRGEFCFMWFDSRNDKLYIFKNSKRPLFAMKAMLGQTVYLASEDWMLRQADRMIKVQTGTVTRVEDEILFGLSLEEGKIKVTETKCPLFQVVHQPYRNWGGSDEWPYTPPETSVVRAGEAKVSVVEPTKTIIRDFESSRQECITREEFDKHTAEGCTTCCTPLSWGYRFSYKWSMQGDKFLPICEDCYDKLTKEEVA